MKASELGI